MLRGRYWSLYTSLPEDESVERLFRPLVLCLRDEVKLNLHVPALDSLVEVGKTKSVFNSYKTIYLWKLVHKKYRGLLFIFFCIGPKLFLKTVCPQNFSALISKTFSSGEYHKIQSIENIWFRLHSVDFITSTSVRLTSLCQLYDGDFVMSKLYHFDFIMSTLKGQWHRSFKSR